MRGGGVKFCLEPVFKCAISSILCIPCTSSSSLGYTDGF